MLKDFIARKVLLAKDGTDKVGNSIVRSIKSIKNHIQKC